MAQGDAQQLPLPDEAADVALAMHMLYHVPRPEMAMAELHRVVRPGGTALVSTNSHNNLLEIFRPFDAIVSSQVGRDVEALPAISFTTESAGGLLQRHFEEVTLHHQEMVLSFAEPGPVIDYVDSLRGPVVSHVGGAALDFDAALAGLRTYLEGSIDENGSFCARSHSGVFVCRR